MKKIICSLLIVLGIILLTGCAKNVDFSKKDHIVCRRNEVKSTESIETTLTFAYDQNEKLKDFKVESDIYYNNSMSKQANEVTAKAMKLISSTLGLFFDSEISENHLRYSFVGNIDTFKLLMKQLNANEEDLKGDTKQEALQELTKEGYTCEDIKRK